MVKSNGCFNEQWRFHFDFTSQFHLLSFNLDAYRANGNILYGHWPVYQINNR